VIREQTSLSGVSSAQLGQALRPTHAGVACGSKSQIPNLKVPSLQIPLTEPYVSLAKGTENRRAFDLEERILRFAREVRVLIRKAPNSISNRAYLYQLAKSSGSVGANYLEANNALSKKDFVMRVRISLKEARESGYWLQLLDLSGQARNLEVQRLRLIRECDELVKIFSTIIKKSLSV